MCLLGLIIRKLLHPENTLDVSDRICVFVCLFVCLCVCVCARVCVCVCRVQNKEWRVHGQMAKYFYKCSPFHILWIRL